MLTFWLNEIPKRLLLLYSLANVNGFHECSSTKVWTSLRSLVLRKRLESNENNFFTSKFKMTLVLGQGCLSIVGLFFVLTPFKV